MKQTVLISGASSGIGLALAHVFAAHGYDLVITARKQQELEQARENLTKQFGVTVKILVNDLSQTASPRQILEFCSSQNLQINILVNNAGFGQYGKFAEADLDRQINMIDLNIRALTELTGLFLPGIIAAKGKILNVASTAAFQPGPLMAVYYASKAFVLSFSEALRNELAETGVAVTALCPGPTKTNFQNITKNFNQTNLIKNAGLMDAQTVAEAGFAGLMANKAVVIPGFRNKLLAFLTRLGPRNLVTAISRWTLNSKP